MSELPRGIRNCNPGNIRLSTIQWRGQVDKSQQTDTSFIQFTDPVYGIRAIVRIIRHYKLQGLNTIREVIERWAPSVENDTEAYVDAVAGDCDVGPDDPVDLERIMVPLVRAIIRHENGQNPYTPDQFYKAVALA